MEEFLKNKYGIDVNTRLTEGPESYLVRDLVRMLRESGTEKNVIYNLHNSALDKEEALRYLDSITNQLVMESENRQDPRKH